MKQENCYGILTLKARTLVASQSSGRRSAPLALQWWYFLDHREIPPDNNLAERALRLAVTKRKVSGGSRSMARFQDTANILSAIQTCRFQGRSVVDFFALALQGQAGVGVKPSLIPNT